MKVRVERYKLLPSKIIPLMYSVRILGITILRIQLVTITALIMSGCVVTATIPSSRHVGTHYEVLSTQYGGTDVLCTDEYYTYGGEIYYYTPYSVPPYLHLRSTYRVPVYYPHKRYAVRRYNYRSNHPNTGMKYEGKQYGGTKYGGGNTSGRRK